MEAFAKTRLIIGLEFLLGRAGESAPPGGTRPLIVSQITWIGQKCFGGGGRFLCKCTVFGEYIREGCIAYSLIL